MYQPGATDEAWQTDNDRRDDGEVVADSAGPLVATVRRGAEGGGHREPLRQCVREAVERYFDLLDGHPTTDLYRMVLGEVEPPLLATVVNRTGGNYSRAAEILGINRGTLRKKLRLYGIE